MDPHIHVKQSGLPDCKQEYFWLSFKDSIKNFYAARGIKIKLEDLDKTSDYLNLLQKQDKYNEINTVIHQYIMNFAWKIIEYPSNYYFNLFLTNIKRWNDISDPEHIVDISNSEYPVFLVLRIMKCVFPEHTPAYNEFKPIFKQLNRETISDGKLLQSMFDVSVKHKKSGAIESILKLSKILDMDLMIINFVQERYNAKISHNYKGPKVLRAIGKSPLSQ